MYWNNKTVFRWLLWASWIVTLDVLKSGSNPVYPITTKLNSNIRCIEILYNPVRVSKSDSWIVTLDVLKCLVIQNMNMQQIVE